MGCENLVLNSNGTLLGRNNNIEKVLTSPLKRFILSLDGFSKEVFEKIRLRAKWDQVYPAIIELCRRRAESGRRYPLITAQFSVMEENAHEVDEYRRFWNALGAEVRVRPMLEWTATGSIRTETIEHNTPFRIACPWSNNTMAVHQDGRVVACAVDYEGRVTVANLRDETICEAWRLLKEISRSPHIEHRWDDIPELCKGCGDWQVADAEYEEEKLENTRPFWFYS